MIAIEIRVNGKLKATCGVDALQQLMGVLRARRPKEVDAGFSYVIECMGVRPLSNDTNEVLKWASSRVALGDEVSFKVVEVKKADAPVDRQAISAHAPSDN